MVHVPILLQLYRKKHLNNLLCSLELALQPSFRYLFSYCIQNVHICAPALVKECDLILFWYCILHYVCLLSTVYVSNKGKMRN